MNTVLQAFTGGFNASAELPDIAERLMLLSEKSGANTVIIGWSTSTPYKSIITKLHEHNIKVLLWLPVFSEYGEEAVTALDYSGLQHAKAVSDAGDDFTFACPGNPYNIELCAKYYDKHFSGCGFDGVFLDKIRFSSFGNGFRSGMGCYCWNCCEYYHNEGVDIHRFKGLMNNGRKDFLLPNSLNGMLYSFVDTLIDDLFRARAKLITMSVNKVADMFRQRGLMVGLDVFAPPFAYLFGQDIEALAACADFIKPMIYRVTRAPAGIPYESEHMKSELLKNGCDIGNLLETLWESSSLTGEDCFLKQLALLKKIPCDVYSGVEVNAADFCATNTSYVKETIKAVSESGIAGCVLSWNVLAQTVYPD